MDSDCASLNYCNSDHECVSECLSDADCRNWEYCATHLVHNECWINDGACNDAADCGPGEECTDHKCVETSSKLPEGAECTVDSECESWEYCTDGYRCTARMDRCSNDSDCRDYEVCEPLGNTCILNQGMCTDANDCASWENCINNACTPAAGKCSSNSDCGVGKSCNSVHECTTLSSWNTEPPMEVHHEVFEDNNAVTGALILGVLVAISILYLVTHRHHEEEKPKPKKKKPKKK